MQAKHTFGSRLSSGNVRQTTLDNVRRQTMDQPTSNKLTVAIAKWIATACRPINIVQDEGLRNIIRLASKDPSYELPSRSTIVNRIHELYETERAKLAQDLVLTATIALTGDYWTSLGNDSYLGVTGHYIDEQWQLHSHALTVMKTEERHHAATCAEHFMDVAKQWNIESKCRKVVGHFKHSPPNTSELEKQQVAHGLKTESLVQDVPTRWNSTLEMVKRLQKHQEPVKDALALHKTNVAMPTKAEMEKLQKLEALLEPCRYFTEILGGEKFVSCSVVLPALCHLSRVMESSEDDPPYIGKFKQTFTLDMEKRKEKTNSTWLKISTALDPRFKDLKCLHRFERAEVWALIAGIMKEEMLAQEPVQTVTFEPPQKKAALLVASESESDEEENYIEKCLERYRAEPVISMEDCPLEWWSKHAGSHPKLACLARKYLATPATSVPCERLFSLSGHIVQKKRAALSSSNVSRLVCLSSWLGSAK
ncbi:E3 SUMO-protein ligase ZBED1-like [Trichomycterus rosablanca]|uniref:E3 SUMO-protein ligase ZBED1-like n=1 Tax=Trichomycterus rosablanca TaxID=2290929 RepID=UPI002F353CF7